MLPQEVTMLFFYLLLLVAVPVFSLPKQGQGLTGRGLKNRGLRGPSPRIVKHGMFPGSVNNQGSKFGRRAPLNRRQLPSDTSCGSGSQLTATAPKANIYAGLTNDEAAAVTSLLHAQLNLTAAATAAE